MSLVAHTREHVTDLYEQSDFKVEYDYAVKTRLSTQPVRCFVQDLRNYALHCRLPVVVANLSLQRVNDNEDTFAASSSFKLVTSRLLRWDGWTAPSRKYIQESGDEIDIAGLSGEYMNLIHDFYSWFREREIEIHSESVARLEARKARLRAKLSITEP